MLRIERIELELLEHARKIEGLQESRDALLAAEVGLVPTSAIAKQVALVPGAIQKEKLKSQHNSEQAS